MERTCPQCGAPLGGKALDGLCPRCVARLALDVGGGPSAPTLPVSEPAAAPAKIRYFGDYELIEEIAQGGMGVVHQARQDSLNRLVALKMIRSGQLATPTEVQRFRAEAEAAASLDHPNIVPIYEVGEHEGRQYFSMKFVAGGSLAQALGQIRRDGETAQRETADAKPATGTQPPLNLRDVKAVARLMAKVARAVHYAHQRGILHRDLKPANILLDPDGEPHVTDFGLAKRLELDSDLTHTGTVLGTPHYMAPEQATGQSRRLSTAADIYSLGSILYHLLTGRPPFKGETALEVLKQVTEREPVRPGALNRRVDRDLETICLKCLEKDSKRRYASANDLANDLERWLRREPISARPISPSEQVWKWLRRRPPIFYAMASAIVLITAVGSIGVFLQWQATQAARRLAANESLERDRQQIKRQQAERETKLSVQQQQIEQARKQDAEVKLELDRVDRWFQAEEADYALAYLARTARQYPSNAAVADRLLAEICEQKIVRQLMDPLDRLADGRIQWALTADGRRALAFNHPGRLTFWDLDAGKEKNAWRFYTIPDTWVPVALSHDGALAAAVESNRRNDVCVWSTSANSITNLVLNHTFSVTSLCFNSNATRLITSSDFVWFVWELPSGRLLHKIHDSSPGVVQQSFLVLNPLAVAFRARSDGGEFLRFFDTETGSQIREIPLNRGTNYLASAVSPDGGKLAVVFRSGTVCVHDFADPQGRLLYALDHPNVEEATFSPDGTFLMTRSLQELRLWFTSDGKEWKRKPWSDLKSARFSPEGLRIVTTAGTKAQIWDVTTLRPICLPIEHRQDVNRAWFSPDGLKVFTVTANRTLFVWDARVGSTEQKLTESQKPSWRINTGQRWQNSASGIRESWLLLPPKATVPDRPWRDAVLPLPVPPMLPRALEAVAGLRLDTQGHGRPTFASDIEAIRSELTTLTGTNLYERVASWLLADPGVRAESPFTAGMEREVDARVNGNTFEDVATALWLEPTNALASARLARQLVLFDNTELSRFAYNNRQGAGVKSFVDFHLARADKHGSHIPEVWVIRAEIASERKETNAVLNILEEASRRFPNDVNLWEQKATLLATCSRPAEALEALNRAYELARAGTIPTATQTRRFLLARSRLLRSLGRTAEAEADEAEARRGVEPEGHWPSWGGTDPGRNLYSTAIGLPESFEAGKMIRRTEMIDMATTRNVRWVAKLGSHCFPSPVISGGKVFIGTNNDSPRDPRHIGDRSILLCLDEVTGELLWQLVVPKLKAGKVNDWEGLGITTTPTVVGNRLYLVTSRAEVLCLDVDGMANGNDGPYLDEANYVVQDLTAKDGTPAQPIPPGPHDADIIWRYDMINELAVFPHNASACSVLVVGDIVYVNTGNGMNWNHVDIPNPDSPSFIALDRHTGKLLGEDTEKIGRRIFHSQWNSPSAGRVNGRQLVFFGGGDGWLYAFDGQPVVNEEGKNILKTVWKCDCNPPEYKTDPNGKPYKYPAAEGPSEVFATPVLYKNRVYVATGQDPEHGEGVGNLVCLDATKSGDITKTGVIWSFRKINRSMSTVAIDPETGLLFTADFSGFIYCLNAETGRLYWQHDSKAHIWGSPMVADGKVFIGNEDGDFMIFAASSQKKLLSKTDLGAPIYTTPTATGGTLYIATTMHLYAVQELRSGSTKR